MLIMRRTINLDSVHTNAIDTPLPAVGFLINRISRLSQRWVDGRLKKFRIAAAAVPVLAILKAERVCMQRDLAMRIGIEQPSMALLLKRMERDGLIARGPNPEDARSALVSLTERANRVSPATRQEMKKGYELITSDLSERELETLTRLLERYLASVESQLSQ